MHEIRRLVANEIFNELNFTDQREKNVFLEYIQAFSFLFYQDDIKEIVEIGAGHSTLIFSHIAKNTGCKVKTIDMNPEAIIGKLRNQLLTDNVFRNIEFIRGASVSCKDLTSYYENVKPFINGIEINEVLKHTDSFIDLVMDGRKESKVLEALGIEGLNSLVLSTEFDSRKLFSKEFLKLYRTELDEFDFCENNLGREGVLAGLLESGQVDMVFLDSGEFVSLVEWEVVAKRLRKGGYVFLHDIFFPKSYKNWLVCASIKSNPDWEVLYIDRTTPQGMMLARKVS